MRSPGWERQTRHQRPRSWKAALQPQRHLMYQLWLSKRALYLRLPQSCLLVSLNGPFLPW